ncbi:DNA glycosylase [Blastocladiella britannica]|nr:DNA glycosylase [Blastocladiella britannica]
MENKDDNEAWRPTYTAIRQWRAEHPGAPVDTEGCGMLATAPYGTPEHQFQVLVGLMLSSKTKDATTAQAMRNLHAHAAEHGATLSVSYLAAMPESELHACIAKVGFHAQKTKFLLASSKMILDSFDGLVPDTIDQLVKLPGVGPKMGHLTLQVAFGKLDGIGVDVHVHRISNRLGWVNTKNPEGTRKALETWLPKDLWAEINKVLVGYGQTLCLPLRPLCATCPVAADCPSNAAKMPASQPPKPSSSAKKRTRRAATTTSESSELSLSSSSDAEDDEDGSPVVDVEASHRPPPMKRARSGPAPAVVRRVMRRATPGRRSSPSLPPVDHVSSASSIGSD